MPGLLPLAYMAYKKDRKERKKEKKEKAKNLAMSPTASAGVMKKGGKVSKAKKKKVKKSGAPHNRLY
jgi:hypothetical protein